MKSPRRFFVLALLLFCSGISCAQENKAGRVLFLGNSITLHGPAENIGWSGNWGMAASTEAKDYVHLMVESLTKMRGLKPEFKVANVAEFERGYEGFDLQAKLKEELAFKPDTVIVAIGENVPELKTDEAKAAFKASVIQLLTLAKGTKQNALYVRSCFWPDAVKDGLLKEACAAAGGLFVEIGALGKDESNYASSERKFSHEGVARHPGDKGMRAIADAILAAIQEHESNR
ncbi:MAG: hypothetical protein JWL90_2035 [Chthoniobacteraceae bacterium]|nr:hypothetical protein [Chthoniobacteraceae bacterium]